MNKKYFLLIFLFFITIVLLPHPVYSFSIVSLNIWHDKADWPQRLKIITNYLKKINPDIICLQEVLQNKSLPNQAETIAGLLKYKYFFASVDNEHKIKRYGNAILSLHPITATDFKKLKPLNDYRVAAHVRILYKEKHISIYNTHLHYGYSNSDIRLQQINDLLDFIHKTKNNDFTFLAGDFNAGPDSTEMQLVLQSFKDPFSLTNIKQDYTTWSKKNKYVHKFDPKFSRIDYILYQKPVSQKITPILSKIIFNTPTNNGLWASDHFGVYCVYSINNN